MTDPPPHINRGPPVEVFPDEIKQDNYVLNELKRIAQGSRDAFGKQIADGTRNTLDVPAHYPFNPERHRLEMNGGRIEPGDIPNQYSENEASHELTPDAGTTLGMHTAERSRYIVGYEASATTAGTIDSTLGAGDTYRVGVSDKEAAVNRSYFEINGDAENRLVLEDEGAEKKTTAFEFPGGIDETDAIRYEIQFNWYNVGRYLFRITYTDDTASAGDKQKNEIVGELVVDGDFVNGDGNYHVFQQLDAATSGQTLRVGSFGYNILGSVEETTRTKGTRLTNLSYGGSGNYEALFAARIDPERGNVYCQLQNLTVFPDGGSGEMLAIVVPEGETDATGFATPPQHSEQNSVIQQTTNVTSFPNSTGTIVSAAANPNGYQIGFAPFEASGTGTNARSQTSANVENKRPLYEDDVAIFLYKADTATARSVNATYFFEQDF
jgi:hypothetical protein